MAWQLWRRGPPRRTRTNQPFDAIRSSYDSSAPPFEVLDRGGRVIQRRDIETLHTDLDELERAAHNNSVLQGLTGFFGAAAITSFVAFVAAPFTVPGGLPVVQAGALAVVTAVCAGASGMAWWQRRGSQGEVERKIATIKSRRAFTTIPILEPTDALHESVRQGSSSALPPGAMNLN